MKALISLLTIVVASLKTATVNIVSGLIYGSVRPAAPLLGRDPALGAGHLAETTNAGPTPARGGSFKRAMREGI